MLQLEVFSKIPKQEINHMKRVSGLVDIMSVFVLLDPRYAQFRNEIPYFTKAAYYHDIGKAWVDPNILTKADKLTEEEFTQIKQHPLHAKSHLIQSGFLVNSVDRNDISSQLVFEAAVYHHERWDGKGYPYGLKGQEIPLIARVTSVCDAYDAMIFERPYSPARPHKLVCREIEKNAGTQFDPDIALLFLKYHHKLIEPSNAIYR